MKIKLLIVALISLLLVIASPRLLAAKNHSLVQQSFLSHLDDSPIPSPLIAQEPSTPLTTETVVYGTQNEQDLVGYLAYPESREAPLPALIVIHEWWGLNENIEAMTRKLAAEGYTALAVDLYKGEAAETPEAAREIMTQALTQPELIEDNLRQAYNYLNETQQATKIGSIGWCFGGTWSLNTALLFPTELDAAVIYYGGGIETDPEKLKSLEMPILGIFGALDQNPDPETVREFEEALISQGKNPEIYIYEDADHAFANPSGTRYNPEAAEDAWSKTVAFLAKNLSK